MKIAQKAVIILAFFAGTPWTMAQVFQQKSQAAQIFTTIPTIVVDGSIEADAPDPNLDGICDVILDSPGNQCSLRAAIMEANHSPEADVIGFVCKAESCTYTLYIPPEDDSTAKPAQGDLNILGDLIILGLGKNKTIIDGKGSTRVFRVGQGKATFRNLTVRGGYAVSGAGIQCDDGEVRVYDSQIIDNEATGAGGGLATTKCPFWIERSVISGNKAPSGGGMSISTGNLTLRNAVVTNNKATLLIGGGVIAGHNVVEVVGSEISFNEAAKKGGGMRLDAQTAKILNSTFAGNSAGLEGGALYNNKGGDVEIGFSTFYQNSAPTGGAVFTLEGGPGASATVHDTILFGGSAGGNCGGKPSASAGHNIDDGHFCQFSAEGDLHDTDPKLNPSGLTKNGGYTKTVSLIKGSPAIDKADQSDCPPRDQRGTLRPQPQQSGRCDIGAYEASPYATLVASADSLSFEGVVGKTTAPLTVTLENGGNSDLTFSQVGLADTANFKMMDNCSGQTIASQSSCTVDVAFSPSAVKDFASSIEITSNGGNHTVSLNALGVQPEAGTSTPSGTPSEPGGGSGGSSGGGSGGASGEQVVDGKGATSKGTDSMGKNADVEAVENTGGGCNLVP